jgi:hypothetical protein
MNKKINITNKKVIKNKNNYIWCSHCQSWIHKDYIKIKQHKNLNNI